jgi:DNA-binding transcriptional MocR family regulator
MSTGDTSGLRKAHPPTGRAYLVIAERVQKMIETAALRPGDRLPSIRELGRAHGVSVPTVQRAMEELEMRGVVEGRARAGFYVSHRAAAVAAALAPGLAAPAGSTPLSKLVQHAMAVAARPGVCEIGPSGASTELFPTLKLHRALSAAARRAGIHGCDYSELAGVPRLRQEIARRSPGSGCCLRPQEIVITAGCTEALALCLRATTKPGDRVAVEKPAFYGMLLLLQSLNLEVIEVPADPRTGLDVEAMRRVLAEHSPAVLLMSGNFSHPTGALMPDEAKQTLVDLLAQHAIPLIEDDIYGDLYFGDRRPPPLKAYDRNGLVLLCDSFSKSISPGYRVGWTAPGRYLERVLELKFAQTAFTATLPQLGIAGFLNGGGYERHLRSFRKILRDNIDKAAAAVTRHFPHGTRFDRPHGGNFLWVRLPSGVDALELHEAAAARGVSIAPGPMFSNDALGLRNCIRLNCARIWTPQIEQAIALLGSLAAARLSARLGEPPSGARN